MKLTEAQIAFATALALKGIDDEGFSIMTEAVNMVDFGEDPSYDAACIAHAIERSNGLAILRLEFDSFWNDLIAQQIACEAMETDIHGIKAT